MITSQRLELPSEINVYCATWTRLGLCAHQRPYGPSDHSGDYARIVSIAKAKVGFVEPILALAVTKLPEGPAWSYELKFDGCRGSVSAAAQRQTRSDRSDCALLAPIEI
jgi:ATP-dependent DNA ligase